MCHNALCWRYEPTDGIRPVSCFVCIGNTPKYSVLIPDRTHLWIHPSRCTNALAHLTLCEYGELYASCVCRRGPCSVCLKRMQARSLTTQTSCCSLCKECLEHRYTRSHWLQLTVLLNKCSVCCARIISVCYFKDKSLFLLSFSKLASLMKCILFSDDVIKATGVGKIIKTKSIIIA